MTSGTTHNVLIVDDDQVDRLMIKELLSSSYTVLESPSGEAARDVLDTHIISCVLLDYNIPGTDSLQLLSDLAQNIPVVMLTGEGNEDIAVSAMKQGAQDYLVKRNINEYLLGRTISTAIETVELKRRLDQKQRELVSANDELRHKVTELECLNSDLENFIHIASHDLREPLKLLFGYCELLERGIGDNLNSDTKEHLDAIRRGAKRLASLIDDLRALTRVTYSKVSEESVDLNELCREILLDFEKMILDRKVIVKVDTMPSVRAYRPLLMELYRNLIDNAVKYGSGDPFTIEMSIKLTGNEKYFVVHNRGNPIPEKDFEKLFQPFYRLPQSRDREGTGMGLALCKKIVERHGGKIWVENSDGGVQFNFSLGENGYRG